MSSRSESTRHQHRRGTSRGYTSSSYSGSSSDQSSESGSETARPFKQRGVGLLGGGPSPAHDVPPELLPIPLGAYEYPVDYARERFHMLIDIEASGLNRALHSIIAIGVAVVGVIAHADQWCVRIVENELFAFPHDDVVFDEALMRAPDGFWHRCSAVLRLLSETARKHALPYAEVAKQFSDYIDHCNTTYHYPQLWSDNAEFDIGWVDLLLGQHAGRAGMAHVAVPGSDVRVFARRALSTQMLGLWVIGPDSTDFLSLHGTPNLMNAALKHLQMAQLCGIVVDHNPKNDVQAMAIDMGRLLCMWAESYRRIPRAAYRPIFCYALHGSEPLAEIVPGERRVRRSRPDRSNGRHASGHVGWRTGTDAVGETIYT